MKETHKRKPRAEANTKSQQLKSTTKSLRSLGGVTIWKSLPKSTPIPRFLFPFSPTSQNHWAPNRAFQPATVQLQTLWNSTITIFRIS